LEVSYTGQDYIDVATFDGITVDQTASEQYAIHQFKDHVATTGATFTWKGQTDIAPTTSTVYLQIYNTNSNLWEEIDSDNITGIDTDFTLTANVSNLTNYKDINQVVTCRIYQLIE